MFRSRDGLTDAAVANPQSGWMSENFCAIQQDRTDLLVPARDEAALRGAIERLASDSALRRRLGQNARDRVEREFARETVLNSLHRFYLSDLGCAPGEHRMPPVREHDR